MKTGKLGLFIAHLMVMLLLLGCGGGGGLSNSTDTTAPQFTSSNIVNVLENSTAVMTVVAEDESEVSYTIANLDTWGQYFNLDSSTGVLSFKVEFMPDYEISSEYLPIVKATDASGNESTQEITIIIWDSSISHNGTEYEAVVSPYTGRLWLDRNLGASQVCTSFNDPACYGDYYQWGRNADGHQDSHSALHGAQATNVNDVGHGFFILSTDAYENDWARTADPNGNIRNTNWGKIDASSICPYGYRVATLSEFSLETIEQGMSNRIDVSNSFLKLPSAGYRSLIDGRLWEVGIIGSFHTYSPTGNSEYLSPQFHISEDSLRTDSYAVFAIGRTVRCIQS